MGSSSLQQWARNLEAAHDELVRRDGALESYRVVFQKAYGSPSTEIGLAL